VPVMHAARIADVAPPATRSPMGCSIWSA
jgi:hypothetical protein